MRSTCGDYGGETHDGQPCSRVPGWGTDEDTGRCKHHRQSGKLESLKKAYLDLLASGEHTLATAADMVGSSVTSMWRMRKEDPAFDDAVRRWKAEADSFRVAMVEDTLFARCVNGEATAAEMIFFLANRAPNRWKSVNRIEVSGPGGGPMEVEHTNARETLQRRINRISSRLGATPPDSRLN